MNTQRSVYLSYLVVVLCVTVTACSGPEAEHLADAGDEHEVENGAPTDTQTDKDENSAEFEKPPTGIPPGDFLEDDDINFSGERGLAWGMWGREHMRVSAYMAISWLYPGEYFVRDGFWYAYNFSWLPRQFRLAALRDGTPIPFRLIEVDDPQGYPSLETIESWDDDTFGLEAFVDLEDESPFNYTLVIPPWAFPEKGLYNLQIIALPQWNPDSTKHLFNIRDTLHAGHTVAYGSETPAIDDHQTILGEYVPTWDSEQALEFHSITWGMFLAPPLEVYDWEAIDTVFDAEMGTILQASEPEITLDFRVEGLDKVTINTAGENLYFVRQDDQIIDSFVLDPGETEVNFPQPGRIVPIDIELTEEPSEVQILVFPGGHEPYMSWGDDYPYDPDLYARDFKPANSNTLILQYLPE